MACVRGVSLLPTVSERPERAEVLCLSLNPIQLRLTAFVAHADPHTTKPFDCCVCLHARCACGECRLLTKDANLRSWQRARGECFCVIFCPCVSSYLCVFLYVFPLRILQVHVTDGNHMSVPPLPLFLCEGVYFHAISQQALFLLTHTPHIDSFSLKRG